MEFHQRIRNPVGTFLALVLRLQILPDPPAELVTQLNLAVLAFVTVKDSSSHTSQSLAPIVKERSKCLDVLGTATAASNVVEGTQSSEHVLVWQIQDHVMAFVERRGTNTDFTDSSFMSESEFISRAQQLEDFVRSSLDIPYASITVTFLASALAFAYPLASLGSNLVKTVAQDTAYALDYTAAFGEIGFAYLFLPAFSVTFLSFDSFALLQTHLSCWPSLDLSCLIFSRFILPEDLLLS